VQPGTMVVDRHQGKLASPSHCEGAFEHGPGIDQFGPDFMINTRTSWCSSMPPPRPLHSL
jgi:hypothetical protein